MLRLHYYMNLGNFEGKNIADDINLHFDRRNRKRFEILKQIGI